MIVVSDGPELLLVTQSDHAHLSGELLSLWSRDGLPAHPRRSELIFAARHHDNGWRETDAAPPVDPESGRPRDFLGMPRDLRFEIWERGTARFLEESAYAALLITQHALELHRDRVGDARWSGFLDRLEQRRSELLERTGLGAPELADDYRFLLLADTVSLAACCRWSRPFAKHGYGGRVHGETVYLKPLPLAGATSFRVPCRRIPDRRYRGDAELGTELAKARWGYLPVRLASSPR